MAKFPKVAPEVLDAVDQNKQVIALVTGMIKATRKYIADWDTELAALASDATKKPVEALIDLTDAVQQVLDTLQQYRDQGLETHATNLAAFMQQSEKAFQELKRKG